MNRINKSATRLFEVWCEVEPAKSGQCAANVLRCFPDTFRDEKVLESIGEFAYPCEFEKTQVQIYSFVLTDTNSQWRFGFCRHDTNSDKAMILVTHLPWHNQFIKYVKMLYEVRMNSPHDFQRFLSETYATGIPDPGMSVKIFSNHDRYTFEFKAPWHDYLPSIPENHNLSVYYNFVEPELMIEVFCAMLNERRIIFTSQHLHVLSSCVLAAGDLIYPMTWQHIYIPVLPMKMKEYVNAPMPYLIGVAKSILQAIRPEELTDVVVLDCDSGTFRSQFDDKKALPRDILEYLRKHLNNPGTGDGVARTFLRAIVQLIGGYRDGLKYGDVITFDDQRFLEARSQKLRPFLNKILDLQIFRQFIDERLISIKDGFSDEFEKEICLYSERISKRKFKLLQNIKDKTNPALDSALQSVSIAREGGRNVKFVYKSASKAVKSKIKNARSANSQGNVMTTSGIEIGSSFDAITPDFNRHRRHSQDSDNNSSGSSSPSHSLSSSDMNILQELEQEGLFDKPELKPKKSSYIDKTLLQKTFSSSPTPPMRRHNQTNLPVVPPRVIKNVSTEINQINNNNSQTHPNGNIPKKALEHSKTAPVIFDSNLSLTSATSGITLPSSAYDPFQIPIVPPRKNQSQPKFQDDSLTLEDFDPLNAKLSLPAQPSASSSNCSITSSNVIGFSNPVYTYHDPKNLMNQQCNSNNLSVSPQPKTNSIELLRDYGILDQYTNLVNGQPVTGSTEKKTQQNNWMTFD
uniref:CSON013290 protein n=1 Tax=Culicoides sonorensis TaxID=179676 RepID=A0A336M7L7_CULSO